VTQQQFQAYGKHFSRREVTVCLSSFPVQKAFCAFLYLSNPHAILENKYGNNTEIAPDRLSGSENH